VVDDGFLGAAKSVVAKHLAQDVLRVHFSQHSNFLKAQMQEVRETLWCGVGEKSNMGRYCPCFLQ
jgi:hypothetical protein